MAKARRFYVYHCEVFERLDFVDESRIFCTSCRVAKICCAALNDTHPFYSDSARFYVRDGVNGTYVIAERTGDCEFDKPQASTSDPEVARVCCSALNRSYSSST